MPPRRTPDPLAQRIGARLRCLCDQRSQTMESLAFHAEIDKGYLSRVEHGTHLPSLTKLRAMADALAVDLIDLVNDPDRGPRNRLVDMTRDLPPDDIARLVGHARRFRSQAELPDLGAKAAELGPTAYGAPPPASRPRGEKRPGGRRR